MSRKVLFTLATAATIAAATLASSAADARGGFGGGGFGGGGGRFGGGGFSRVGIGGGHLSGLNASLNRFPGTHFPTGHFPTRHFPGNHFPGNHFPGHFPQWVHHHHHHWFWRDGRWVIIEDAVGGYDEPQGVVAAPVVAAPGPCTCLTKTYTQDGLVVFADVCTKEAASARVDGAEMTPVPPVKSSELTPPPPPPNAAVESQPDVSQAPTTNNYAGKTFKDFLAAQKN
jgi:hypothetical protein